MCSGGLQNRVYDYMKAGNPIKKLEDYPYTADISACLTTLGSMEDAATVSDYLVQYKSDTFIAPSVIKLALQTLSLIHI